MLRWKKPAGGGSTITQSSGASNAPVAAATLARPALTAPDKWICGEDFTFDGDLADQFKEREVRFGSEYDLSQVPCGDQRLVYMALLHLAVTFNRVSNVRTLLAAGADAGHYWRGQTPLFTAARFGHIWLVRILHEQSASLDHPAVTSKGQPVLAPLHAAAAKGHTNVVRYLLSHGADVEQPRGAFQPHDVMTLQLSGSAGSSALWVACSNGCVSTAQFLLSHGAQIGSTDDAGRTPLHAACSAGHSEVVRLLLENGASHDVVSWDDMTPLMQACAEGHCECVRVLLEAGADPFRFYHVSKHLKGQPDHVNAYSFGNREVVDYIRGLPTYVAYIAAQRAFVVDPTRSPPSSPQTKRQRKPQRLTPLGDRAMKVGVSHKLQATPPGIRETIHTGSPSSSVVQGAKKKLQAVQTANHQIVSRAEQRNPRNLEIKRAGDKRAAAQKQVRRATKRLAYQSNS